MGIFDGLPNPAAPGQAFMAGMERGRAAREEQEVRGALSAYATNPDDPRAFETLARWKPELAISIRADRSKREQEARQADLQRRAAQGDRGAQAELWGLAPEIADKLSDNQRQELTQRVGAIGNAALRIAQLPPEQRPQAWDAAVEQLSRDYPELAEYRGQYSDEMLNSAIDNAKLVTEHFRLSMPEQFNIGPGEGRYERDRISGQIRTIVEPNLSGAPAFSPARPSRTIGGKTYWQDGNGDWYEGDPGGNAGGGF